MKLIDRFLGILAAEASMKRLDQRKAAKAEKNPHKRGWLTRQINAGCK